FNQICGALVAEVGERGEDADAAAVSGDFRVLDPVAIGVKVEVVAGLHRGVHVGDGDAVCVLRVGGHQGKNEKGAGGEIQGLFHQECSSGCDSRIAKCKERG